MSLNSSVSANTSSKKGSMKGLMLSMVGIAALSTTSHLTEGFGIKSRVNKVLSQKVTGDKATDTEGF